jgi:hypothetical protein
LDWHNKENMTKVYLKLTADQKARGVIFSSTLAYRRTDNEDGLTIHEVLATEADKDVRIGRLLDDSFFNGSLFKYNVVRR